MNKIFKPYFAIEKGYEVIYSAGDTIGLVVDKIKDENRNPNDFNYYQIKDTVIYQLKIKVG